MQIQFPAWKFEINFPKSPPTSFGRGGGGELKVLLWFRIGGGRTWLVGERNFVCSLLLWYFFPSSNLIHQNYASTFLSDECWKWNSLWVLRHRNSSLTFRQRARACGGLEYAHATLRIWLKHEPDSGKSETATGFLNNKTASTRPSFDRKTSKGALKKDGGEILMMSLGFYGKFSLFFSRRLHQAGFPRLFSHFDQFSVHFIKNFLANVSNLTVLLSWEDFIASHHRFCSLEAK